MTKKELKIPLRTMPATREGMQRRFGRLLEKKKEID